MEDKEIMVKWEPFTELLKCMGHQMPDGWWYVNTQFDDDWHFVTKENVFEIKNSELLESKTKDMERSSMKLHDLLKKKSRTRLEL